jgi:hypothetical protein
MEKALAPVTVNLLDRFVSRAQKYSAFISRQPAALIISALVVISFLRTGFVLWNWFFLSPNLLTQWGNPDNPFQSNLIFNAFGTGWLHVFGSPEGPLWLLAQVGLAILGISLIAVLVHRRTKDKSGYLATALVLSSGIAAVLWREIGRYDVIFLVAIAFALLARARWIVWLSLAVAAVSAPEQAMLAGIALLALTFAPTFRAWRNRALGLTGLAIAATVAVQIWFTAAGDPYATRLGLMFRLVSGSDISAPSRFDAKQGAAAAIFQKFYEGLANGPSLIWSYLGASVLLLLATLLIQQSIRAAIWVLLVVICFPLFTTLIFGEDPTRDLVIVGAPMILLICVVGSSLAADGFRRLPGLPSTWLVWAATLVSLVPMLYFFVYPEAAFDFGVHLLISWNNGTAIDWSGNVR